MVLIEEAKATLDDLYRVDGKAELIDGRIVHMMATGRFPNQIAGRIYSSLLAFADKTGIGEAFTDNMGFAVKRLFSGRESFSPDASFYSGPFTQNPMRFIEGAPTFAVEVRSERDYRAGADVEMAAKRADYFEAGTQVVWDVDSQEKCIYCYRKSAPYKKEVFRAGQIADAEPAVPAWRLEVDKIFPQ